MKKSDQILLGIYQHWPRLDADISFEAAELAWIIYHGVDGWRIENRWKKIEYSAVKSPEETTYLDKPLRDRGLVAKELTILQANDCLEFTRPSGFDMRFKIKLQPNGLLRAESLSSTSGRVELWYSEHKNGILGLIVTIAVAAITAWITSIFTSNHG